MIKGISPLVATVLLLAIAFTMATIISPWVFNLIRSNTDTLGNKSSSVTDCNVVTIENVYLDFQGNKSRVYVLAKGGTTVLSASLLSTNGIQLPLSNPSVLPLTLGDGERKLIEFNLTSGILPACQNFSKVVIATSCLSDEMNKAVNC